MPLHTKIPTALTRPQQLNYYRMVPLYEWIDYFLVKPMPTQSSKETDRSFSLTMNEPHLAGVSALSSSSVTLNMT